MSFLSTGSPALCHHQGCVWLDLNCNGILDNKEYGVEDVLVELCTPGQHDVKQAIKIGSDRKFQFVVDVLDLGMELISDGKFYIQVYAPDGYKFLTL